MDTLTLQLQAFGMVILAGLTCGILFDVYRVLRGIARMRRLTTTFADILFWVVLTPTVVAYLLLANWLELRFYVFLGLALGLFLHFTILSPFIIPVILSIGRGFGVALQLVVRGVWMIIILPLRLVSELGYRLGRRWPPRLHRGGGIWRAGLRWRRRLLLPGLWWKRPL